MQRRDFLLSSSAAAARAAGANDRVRVGVIGTGGRGQYLMKELLKADLNVELAAVCDIYDVRRAQAAKIPPTPAEQYLDYQQVVARKDLDAVIVATPDHWHAPIAVAAMDSGKDVYIEKPMVHFPADGQAIVRAARRNRRIVQAGTQGRTLPQFVLGKEKYVDSGIIGKVGVARTWYTSNQGYVQETPPGMQRKPEGLDWERWLGRGPKVAWDPNIYFSPYKWLHYDGGMIMGIGIHVVDSAHHWLGLTRPAAAVASGGTFHFNDGRDTPDVISFSLEYPEKLIVTFLAECLTCKGVKTSAGVELRGTGGLLWAERYVQDTAWQYTPNTTNTQEPAAKGPGKGVTAAYNLRNWVECIRSRQRSVCNEEVAYYSTMACFMAAQAYKTKSRVVWDKTWDLPS